MGFSQDCNSNGIPDDCETDCNSNGLDDECDLASATSEDCNVNGILDSCDLASGTSLDNNNDGIPDECRRILRRGDANGDGLFDVGDAIKTLAVLFSGEALLCEDAADANDDGVVDIADGIFTLTSLFGGGPVPPAPGPNECGPDLTPDNLEDCEVESGC